MINRIFLAIYSSIILLVANNLFLLAQENPGDVWLVVPQGVQPDDSFYVELHINTGSQLIAAYTFELTYDASLITVDTTKYGDGKEPVPPHGFVTVTASAVVGTLVCSSFDVEGTGPGTDIHFLNLHFTARSAGCSPLNLIVSTLKDPTIAMIGSPRGISNTVVIGSTGMTGDVNASGTVDIADALLVARYCTIKSRLVALDQAVADVNSDGSINILDALLIAQYAAGMKKQQP